MVVSFCNANTVRVRLNSLTSTRQFQAEEDKATRRGSCSKVLATSMPRKFCQPAFDGSVRSVRCVFPMTHC